MSQDTSQFDRPSIDRAWQLYEFRRYKEALQSVMEFLASSPQSPRGYVLLALIHAKENRKSQAYDAAKQAISLSPDWSHPHYIHGFIAYLFDEYTLAEKHLDEAMRLSPNDADYFALMAEIQNVRGNLNTGRTVSLKGLEIDAVHEGCLYQQGVSLWYMNRKDVAEQVFRELLKINPEHSRAQGFIGHIETESGDHRAGLHLLRNCLRENPEWSMAQESWKEALVKHYAVYRIPAKIKGFLLRFKFKWILMMMVVIGVLTIGSALFPKIIQPVWIQIAFVAIVIAAILVLLLFGLINVHLGLVSRVLFLLDRDLRRTWTIRSYVKSHRKAILFAVALSIMAIFFIASDKPRKQKQATAPFHQGR